jgi:hypothetical protein
VPDINWWTASIRKNAGITKAVSPDKARNVATVPQAMKQQVSVMLAREGFVKVSPKAHFCFCIIPKTRADLK